MHPNLASWRSAVLLQNSLVLFALLTGLPASPATIPGLFNTGLDNAGTALPNSSVDPHYRLVQSADPASPGPNAIVVIDTLFPIVTGPWLANSAQSKWIAPKADQSGGSAAGDYVYRITFNLTGLDPTTAVITGRWTSDNAGTDIRLNGVSTGITFDGNFGTFSVPFTINNGFAATSNYLDFVVNNASTTANPTAFRAEISGTAELLAPPGTPPSIVASPSSQSVNYGESALFSGQGYGSLPLLYQWLHDGVPIAGATNVTYPVGCATLADAGAYR
jgi:hypothetical protein